MKITFHHPTRILEFCGPRKVSQLLKELEILPETVLVILKKEGTRESDELLPPDSQIGDSDSIEIRPVISGGSR
ncbi:MAG: thiamine biosynthesis protein ThiS [Nitrospirae bacterium]|nr:thiamine biosynthesis protein ThiS [Nitrospirota bacterium]MBI3594931.1 thiamine biosynthesis protein ThiS [Nitrospirota bacterium]